MTPGRATDHEIELALRVMEGDEDAFREVTITYGPRVLGFLGAKYASSVTGRNLAEDILQEALLRAWRSIGTFDPGKNTLGGWLLRIAQNCAIDAFEGEKKAIEVIENADCEARAADPPGDTPLTRAVDEIVQGLTPRQRHVVTRLVMCPDGTTAVELAGEMQTSPGAIRVEIHKVKEKIVRELEKRGFVKDGRLVP